jgi:FKBP12-rapamycin complex-associated protein
MMIDCFLEQGKLISDELIRVTILWHEQWHDGLDEASKVYFQDKSVNGMFEILEPLHNMIEKGPDTLKEQSFNQVSSIFCTKMINFSDLLY